MEGILRRNKVARYQRVKTVSQPDYRFTPTGPGRPGPETRYRRQARRRWRLQWTIDEEKIAYDRKSDGMYPLLTNDVQLTSAQVLQAHKRQPTIVKRFEQIKTVFEIAPVLLKNEGHIEALFFVYFLALLVQALIERELRRAMQQQQNSHLPFYPEERSTSRPTAEQIFRLFSLLERHQFQIDGQSIHRFDPS